MLGASAVVFVLATWSLLSGLDIVPQNKLPAPWETATALVQLAVDGTLWPAVVSSVSRIVMASVLVLVIGGTIGILMGASPDIDAFCSPLVDPFRSAPVAALLPIFVMWLGIDEGMKVAFLYLGAVVYFIPMTRDAIRGVPPTYWISACDLGATSFEAVMKGVLPLAWPRIADAFVAAVSIEWTYITVAEYVNANSGLGQILSNAKRFSAMDNMFATIIVIIALSLITYHGMLRIKKALFPWEIES
jgi:ABC-type nitrate/sulfonate/bicarbonate transport system permease component